MPRTIDQVIAWAHANPTPHQGGTWSERCEQFVNNAGGFSTGFPSALDDRQTAERSPLYASADALPLEQVPPGWLLFWDYTPYGHVAFQTSRGALMASNYVTDPIAPALGYIPATAYAQASGHRYLGASPYHGLETLQGAPMSLLTPDDISKIAQAVWTQALNDAKGDGTHQAATFLMWASRAHHLPTTAPAAVATATGGPSHAELVAALTDPTVQAALAAAVAHHLPTKIVGTLTS